MHEVRCRLCLGEEHHAKDHRQSQFGTALPTMPRQCKNLQRHYSRDVARLLGKKKLWSKGAFCCFPKSITDAWVLVWDCRGLQRGAEKRSIKEEEGVGVLLGDAALR